MANFSGQNRVTTPKAPASPPANRGRKRRAWCRSLPPRPRPASRRSPQVLERGPDPLLRGAPDRDGPRWSPQNAAVCGPSRRRPRTVQAAYRAVANSENTDRRLPAGRPDAADRLKLSAGVGVRRRMRGRVANPGEADLSGDALTISTGCCSSSSVRAAPIRRNRFAAGGTDGAGSGSCGGPAVSIVRAVSCFRKNRPISRWRGPAAAPAGAMPRQENPTQRQHGQQKNTSRCRTAARHHEFRGGARRTPPATAGWFH